MPARVHWRVAAAVACAVMAWGQGGAPPIPRNAGEAENLELQVRDSPGDAALRAQLIRYYSRQRTVTDKSRILRGQHILWMIENDPGNAVLGEPAGTIDREGHAFADAYAYGAADQAWRAVLKRAAPPAAAFANAASFYRSPDAGFARRIASEGLKRFPKDVRVGAVAGVLDALTMLGGEAMDGSGTAISVDERLMFSPEALDARREIEGSLNVGLLGSVTGFLMQQVPALRHSLRPPQMKGVLDFAARCYERAIAIEPENGAWKSGLRNVYRLAAGMPAKPGDRMVYLERASRVPVTDAENLSFLPELAQARLDARDFDKAGEAAGEALRLAAAATGAAAANAVHVGHVVLGRLALKRGNLEEAKSQLQAAGRITALPGGSAPDWQLASELLAKGEKAAVLAYIEACRAFWRRDEGKLDAYAAAVRAGEWPFGKR